MIRILIADDHAMMREGLKKMLANAEEIELAGEAQNGQEVLDRIESTNCNLLMLDMTMPGLSGIELILHIRKSWPNLPILVLSMHNSGRVAFSALQAGANGYLAKDSDPGRLAEVISIIAAGGRYIDPMIADKIALDPVGRILPHEGLTQREKQILLMIVSGKPVNKIAEDLYISPKTVSTHKSRIMEKMNINNNADLIRYCSEHHLGKL